MHCIAHCISHLIDEFESLMLGHWQYIPVFLVERLTLPMWQQSLNPSVIPIGVNFFAGNHHATVRHGKEGAVLAETNL